MRIEQSKGPIDVLLMDTNGVVRQLFSFTYTGGLRIDADRCRPDIAFNVDGEL